MERLLLLWDELDDLVGISRCLASRALMRITPALPSTAPLRIPAKGLLQIR